MGIDFQSIEKTAMEIRRLSDHDFNHELAGLDVGRQARHLPKSARDTPLDRQKKDEQRATMTALHWLLLMDAEYAQQRERVQRVLLDTDTRLIEMHLEAEAMLAQHDAMMQAKIAEASTLDGEKVFLSRDGSNAETLDGRVLSTEERDRVGWVLGAVTLDEIREDQRRREKIVGFQTEIHRVQRTVEAHQHTLAHDHDDPTTRETFTEMEQSTRDAMGNLERMRHDIASDPSADIALSSEFNSASPDLDFTGMATSSQPSQLSAQQ